MVTHIVFASDHGGYNLKAFLMAYAKEYVEVYDVGCYDTSSCDYPDFVKPLSDYIQHNVNAVGVAICKTGIGMSIALNRYSHIRASLCHEPQQAILTREHNDANVLVLGADYISDDMAKILLDNFLHTSFDSANERHQRRVQKLS